MRTVPAIIEDLGNPASISRETGIPLTTIDGWRRSGFVPEWRRPTLITLAKSKGKRLADADFPQERPRQPRPHEKADAA